MNIVDGIHNMFRFCLYCVLGICLSGLIPVRAGDDSPVDEALAEEEESGEGSRLYRTRSERREAGLDREILPWLRFSGLAELEAIGETFAVEMSDENLTATEEVAVVQLGLVAEPLDWITGELILEFDSAFDEIFVEEAVLASDIGDWELSIGRQYLPFGVYYSNFITGPILEIGETQEDAVTLTWDHDDRIEFSASVYEGIARREDQSDNKLDYTLALNGVIHERLGVGVSYLTDLGDADGRLLEEAGNRFARKVAGFSAGAIWIGDNFESTVEILGALENFDELESDRDRPLAWNLELALFVHPKAELNFRLEGSRQIEGFPEHQWGLATNIQLHRRAFMTLEFLHGEYRRGIAVDDEDNPLRNVTTLAAQLSIAF